jgi:hypothetical protein
MLESMPSDTPLFILISTKGLAMEEKKGKSRCLWDMWILCSTGVLESISHSKETY